MTTVKDVDEKTASEVEIAFDLKEIYSVDPKKAVPDISSVHYSNLAYINVSRRDVCIDFLELPGIKQEGKLLIHGTRIYMTHIAAQKLAKALDRTLDTAYDEGAFEKYEEKQKPEKP